MPVVLVSIFYISLFRRKSCHGYYFSVSFLLFWIILQFQSTILLSVFTISFVLCHCLKPMSAWALDIFHLQSRWQPCKSELYLACVLQVIDVHDCKSIYRVPLLLANQNIVPLFAKRLQMEIKSPRKPRHFMVQWKELAERCALRLQIFDSSSLSCQILLSLFTGIKHRVEKRKREETIYWYLGENERLNIQFTGLQKVPFRAFHWIVANSYQRRTNDLLTSSSITNYERTTGELTIWLTIDDCLTVTIDGSKRTNYWLRVFIANNITA